MRRSFDDLIKQNEEISDSDIDRCKNCFCLVSKKTDYDNKIYIVKCLEISCKLFDIEKIIPFK